MVERVWDKFLTENDRAALAAARERPPYRRSNESRAALLLIDLYREVFGDGPEPLVEALERWPSSCGPAAWEALPHIERLLAGCRAAGMPIVHVTGLSGAGIAGWAGRGRSSRPAETESEAATRYRIIDQVAPAPGEAVIHKSSPSPFFGTPLMAHLTANRVDTVIVCGESTSGCVRATVVDARTARLDVIVAEECVFDRHEAPHAINLFDMDQKYADVLPLDEVLALFGRPAELAAAAR